jgi:DNA-directed RNA polymerase subunit RPC12/RpoP
MSELDLEAIMARANAATIGPWETVHNDTYVSGPTIDHDWDWIIGDLIVEDGETQADYRGTRIKENCIFVANARQDIPALFNEVKALRARISELEAKDETVCPWSEEAGPDGDPYYSTSCGGEFIMIEDLLKENEFKFCAYCGKKIVELVKTEEPQEGAQA